MTSSASTRLADVFRPRYWHSRFMLVCLVGSMLIVTAWEPHSLVHQVISRAGQRGWFWVGLLMVLLAVAMVDLLVNDILPDRFDLYWLRRWRFIGYMALASGLLSICTVIWQAHGGIGVALLYFWPALFAAHIAITDLYHWHHLRRTHEEETN